MQSLALYLHIPFCRARCSYCAFNIYTDRAALIDSYIMALCKEISLLGQGERVESIYLGGGTPSLLSPEQGASILKAITGHFDLSPQAEITLEVNPGTVDQNALDKWRALGVNRLSIGMQSAHVDELSLFERDHSYEETQTCIRWAQNVGFDNISLDLIYGAPRQNLATWEASLQAALSLNPQHFSLYALQLENGTALKRAVNAGALPTPDDDLTADLYELAGEKLGAAGFEQYEISSWSLPNYASRHNLQYWHNLPYLGLGAGAHGCAGGLRTVNAMRPERYIERINATQAITCYPLTQATQSYEEISPETEIFETIMLNLRLLKEGLSRPTFAARFGFALEDRYSEVIANLKGRDLLYENEQAQTLHLTPEARLIANQVIGAFLL